MSLSQQNRVLIEQVAGGWLRPDADLSPVIRMDLSMLDRLLDAARAQTAWQPMATAPRDGTPIDLWIGTQRFANCRWDRPIAGYSNAGNPLYSENPTWISANGFMQATPSHWRVAAPPPPLTQEDPNRCNICGQTGRHAYGCSA